MLDKLTNNKILVSIMLGLLAVALCYQNLVYYLIPNTSLFVFLAISPFIFTINKTKKSNRFAWFSIAFIILYFFFKMQLLFFLSFSAFILFVIESNLGRVNSLPIFIILLISPYSSFIFNVFGFPIRLQLTEAASSLLSVVFDNVSSSGNNILINHQKYSVDPECMGLTMVGYGYATTLLLINSFERKFNLKVSLAKVIGILSISTVFIITVNLFRIITIVILDAQPETIIHELVGLFSFVLYLIIPMYFITKWMIKKSKPSIKKETSTKLPNHKLTLAFSVLIITSLGYFNINRGNYRNIQVDTKSSQIVLAGFTKSITNENVVKFENDEALIYIKPSCQFYGPDHSPTICWKGSGYEFTNIKTESIGTIQIYTAELNKEGNILYTSWWFDNGKHKTISQLNWRWKTALGDEPYRLINITSTNKKSLNSNIYKVINKNLFNNSTHPINLNKNEDNTFEIAQNS